MNVLLIDNNPHLQKTLQYFLHPYAPSIYCMGTQEELPTKIDIVFLDSEQKDNPYISELNQKEEKPPIVLISRDEKTLEQLASQYPASLKKPIEYKKLQDIVHHLVPETKNFKASPYLKFYEPLFEEQAVQMNLEPEKSIQNTEQKQNFDEQAIQLDVEPQKEEGLSTETSIQNTEQKQNFDEQAIQLDVEPQKEEGLSTETSILIPDDIKLVDETESTSLHNTNTFLKKVSETIKTNTQISQTPTLINKDEPNPIDERVPDKSLVHKDEDVISRETGIQSELSENDEDVISQEAGIQSELSENENLISTENNYASQNDESLTPQDPPHKDEDVISQEAGIQSELSENENLISTENNYASQNDESLTPQDPPHKDEDVISQEAGIQSELSNIEKWDTLSEKIIEIIDKHFQNQWETFIKNQLKKDLKKMIHEEVTQIFKEQMKDILTTEGIQSIKKASEEISWKVIPELSRQIIQKEIKKLLQKPAK